MNITIAPIIAFNNYARIMKWNRVDFDWAYNYQCVDLIRDYAKKNNYPPITTRWNAIDLWKKWLGNWYKRVYNSMVWVPPVGSIILYWTWIYWHIAITWRANLLWVDILEQNGETWNWMWLGGDAIRITRNFYRDCLWWFIPIK